MTKILTAAVLTVLAMSVSACGSNDDAKASKAISASIMKSQKSTGSTSSFFSMKKKDADCIGDGLVSKIGTDKLKKYGLLTKGLKTKDSVTDVKMSSGDASSATGVLFKCTDVVGMMKTSLTKSGSVPATMKACVDKALTEGNLRPMFTKIFQGQSAAAQKELTTPLMKCATGSGG
jgi:hypothetical protein